MSSALEKELEQVVYGITNPIESVNPLTVFFHGFYRLAKKVVAAPGLGNKLLVLIMPPGWQADAADLTCETPSS